MSERPRAPNDWKTTKAIRDAKNPAPVVRRFTGGKKHPFFNGSQNNPNTKKRPITLPGMGRTHEK